MLLPTCGCGTIVGSEQVETILCKKTSCQEKHDSGRLQDQQPFLLLMKKPKNGEANNFYLKSCPANWVHLKRITVSLLSCYSAQNVDKEKESQCSAAIMSKLLDKARIPAKVFGRTGVVSIVWDEETCSPFKVVDDTYHVSGSKFAITTYLGETMIERVNYAYNGLVYDRRRLLQ